MTTTDPFTEAELADYARAEAETRWPQRRTGHYVQQLAFVAGAEWARDHLAVQEPTDAEKAVRELHAPRCHGMRDREGNPVDSCDHCYGPDGYNATYPCATIRALDAARAARRDEEDR